jgi:hypothetical protein
MEKNNIYVLIHSPLVGPLTWALVADQMRQRGLDVIVPILNDSPDSKGPFWRRPAESVSQALANIPGDTPVTLVAHSGAGPLLPAIRQSLANPVNAYVFVDADIPVNRATRLDLMRSEDPDWAAQFQEFLEGGGMFPTWSFDDLQEVIPDEGLRKQMVDEIRPRGMSFFTEPISVFDGWPDAPCAYIKFSSSYEYSGAQASQAGWPTYELEAGHFYMLIDPQAVMNLIVEAVKRLT